MAQFEKMDFSGLYANNRITVFYLIWKKAIY